MAERRMFAKTIIDSDAFLEMPPTTQNLYFHLAMRADDDGFINRPKSIMRMCGARDDDMSILIAKKFIIPFDTGVVVIKHWKIHNYIQKDRYKPTVYQKEKALLVEKSNKSYRLIKPGEIDCIQNVYNTDTQDRLGKDRDSIELELGKDNLQTTSVSADADSVKASRIDYPAILTYWNEKSKLKPITAITDKRKSHLNARIKEYGNDSIFKVIDNISNSPFLQGQNSRNWMADFDWVIRPNNYVKVLEGNYNDKQVPKPAPIKQDMTILEKDDLLSRLYSYAETCYNRELLEYEKTMISEWFDSGYSYDQISKAIFDSLKAKKMHLQYANSLLYSRTTRPTAEIDPELRAMLDSVFKKSA